MCFAETFNFFNQIAVQSNKIHEVTLSGRLVYMVWKMTQLKLSSVVLACVRSMQSS